MSMSEFVFSSSHLVESPREICVWWETLAVECLSSLQKAGGRKRPAEVLVGLGRQPELADEQFRVVDVAPWLRSNGWEKLTDLRLAALHGTRGGLFKVALAETRHLVDGQARKALVVGVWGESLAEWKLRAEEVIRGRHARKKASRRILQAA